MPRIAGREETGEVVVVRQILLIVVTEGTRAGRIIQISDRCGGVEEIVHGERTVGKGGGCVPSRIAAGQRCIVMAFVPRRGEILGTNRGFVEGLYLSTVVVVIGQRDGGVEAVDGLRVCDAELSEPPRTIASQFPKVHVEGAILLKHEEDMLDHTCIAVADGHGRSLRDAAPVAGGRAGRVGCGRRRRDGCGSLWYCAGTADSFAGVIDDGE